MDIGSITIVVGRIGKGKYCKTYSLKLMQEFSWHTQNWCSISLCLHDALVKKCWFGPKVEIRFYKCICIKRLMTSLGMSLYIPSGLGQLVDNDHR